MQMLSLLAKLTSTRMRSSYSLKHLSVGAIHSRRSEPGVRGAEHASDWRTAAPCLKVVDLTGIEPVTS